jgi:hypothetical protein
MDIVLPQLARLPLHPQALFALQATGQATMLDFAVSLAIMDIARQGHVHVQRWEVLFPPRPQQESKVFHWLGKTIHIWVYVALLAIMDIVPRLAKQAELRK